MTTAVSKVSPETLAKLNAARLREKSKIAKVKIAQKQLNMDDSSYRLMLLRVTGKDSLTQCHEAHIDKVLKEMMRLGFKSSKPKTAQPPERRKLDMHPSSQKARALWLLLHELGAVQNPAEAALAGYVLRMTGVEDLAWINGDQIDRVIETLKKWAVRVFPDALQARFDELIAARLMLPSVTLVGFITSTSPSLKPDTFDALNNAYERLKYIRGGV